MFVFVKNASSCLCFLAVSGSRARERDVSALVENNFTSFRILLAIAIFH